MSKSSLIFLSFTILSLNQSIALVNGNGCTIQDAFNLALKHSTAIPRNDDQIAQSQAQIAQAKSGYLPTVALQISATQQDDSTNPLAKSLSSTQPTSSNLNFSQNIFQGFRNSSLVSEKKYMKMGFEWSKKQAIVQLYKDVAQSFYSILIFQSDIVQYLEQIESTKERKSELLSAKKSGRARDSDILSSLSSIASLEAAISKTEGLLATVQESLRFLTGLSKDERLIGNIDIPLKIENLDWWMDSISERPDIQQSKSILQASQDSIDIAKAGYYPTLQLTANYYLSRPVGIFQGVDWDTNLTLSFPFFSGGLTKALIAEASSFNHSKGLAVRLNQEIATQSIRTAFQTVQADRDQLTLISNAADLSKQSYNLVHRDNTLGIAKNTDVLMALQVWQESKRNLERTRITTYYDYLRLKLESSKMKMDGGSDFKEMPGERK